MVTVKVLKRKDAASVVVAVVLGLIVAQAIQAWSVRPAQFFSGASTGGGGWRMGFWQPLLILVVELVLLEAILTLYTTFAGGQLKK